MNIQSSEVKSSKILFGLGWTSLSTIINGLTQILRISILARFLEKEDFGIVAILTLILGLTQVFSDMGFSAAIMSEKKLPRSSFISLYWMQFIVFNGIFVLGSLTSPLIADYYDEDALSFLVPLMLLELSFLSIGKLYDTVLQKQFQFKIIAVRNITASTISLIFAVILAVLGMGVYSLILSILLQAFIINIWNFIKGQKIYKLGFEKIRVKEVASLLKVGYYYMATNIIDYIAGEFDVIIISSFLGIGAVGIYNLAKDLVLKFTTVINTIVAKVMLPFLADSNDNISQLKTTFLNFMKYLSIINIPIIGIVFIYPDILVDIFYGSDYQDAAVIVKIMAVWSLIVILNSPNGQIAIVTKRTDITFFYTILRLVVLALSLYLFARDNLVNAAFTMVASYVIMFFVNWYVLLYNVVHIYLSDFIKVFYKPLLVVLCLIILTYLVQCNIELYILYVDILLFVFYILIYLSYLYFFEKDIVSRVSSILNIK